MMNTIFDPTPFLIQSDLKLVYAKEHNFVFKADPSSYKPPFFSIKTISLHPLLWMNVVLDCICIVSFVFIYLRTCWL